MRNFSEFVENRSSQDFGKKVDNLCLKILGSGLSFDQVWTENLLPVIFQANYTNHEELLNEFLGFSTAPDERRMQNWDNSLAYVKKSLLFSLAQTTKEMARHASQEDNHVIYNIAIHFYNELSKDIEQYDPVPKFVRKKRARRQFEKEKGYYTS